jgi:MerR family redox-sensitive transcriptional activator SoxR
MKLLSIGEVARRTGVRPSALRYYEEEGILPAATRINGRRRYDTDMVRMIEVLRFAQQAGFTLKEIKTLFRGFDRGKTLSARWHSLATSKLEELDALVASAARMRRAIEVGLRCGCVRLEDCALPETNLAQGATRRRQRSSRNVRS